MWNVEQLNDGPFADPAEKLMQQQAQADLANDLDEAGRADELLNRLLFGDPEDGGHNGSDAASADDEEIDAIGEEAEVKAEFAADMEAASGATKALDEESFGHPGDHGHDGPDDAAPGGAGMDEPEREKGSAADPEGGDDESFWEGDGINAEDDNQAKRSRWKAWRLSALANRADPIWILRNRVPAGLTVVYGLPKTGKSFWCIELATCFAVGVPFHGRKLGKSGRVLYVAAEGGGKAIYNRIMAIAHEREIPEADLEPNLEIVENGIDLNTPESVAEFLRENPGSWGLVVIDTLARCMSGDENSTVEMNAAIVSCDHIRRNTGGDLILVHHQGWGSAKRPRGASALFGAVDGLIRVYRNEARYTVVEVEALREGAVNDNNGLLFRLVDGVMEEVAREPAGVEKLRERESKMLEALETLSATASGSVPIRTWRGAVESITPPILDGKSKRSKDQQWRRAFDKLKELEFIKVHGANVVPSQAEDVFSGEEAADAE